MTSPTVKCLITLQRANDTIFLCQKHYMHLITDKFSLVKKNGPRMLEVFI